MWVCVYACMCVLPLFLYKTNSETPCTLTVCDYYIVMVLKKNSKLLFLLYSISMCRKRTQFKLPLDKTFRFASNTSFRGPFISGWYQARADEKLWVGFTMSFKMLKCKAYLLENL